MMRRKLVVDPRCSAYIEGYRTAMRQARAELAQSHFKTLTELSALRREVEELRALHIKSTEAMRQAQAAALATAQARAEHRERELTRAWSVERDLGQPVH